MDFTIGTYIAIAAVLLFYLRLIILQRQKLKQTPQKPGKKSGKGRNAHGAHGPAAQHAFRPGLVLANKPLVFTGAALILLGAAVAFITSLDAPVRDAWWIPVTAGIVLMSLGIR